MANKLIGIVRGENGTPTTHLGDWENQAPQDTKMHVRAYNLLILGQVISQEQIPFHLLEDGDTLWDFLRKLTHPADPDLSHNFGWIAILVRCSIQTKLRVLASDIVGGRISLNDAMSELKKLISSTAYRAITDEMKQSPLHDDTTKIGIVLKHMNVLLEKN